MSDFQVKIKPADGQEVICAPYNLEDSEALKVNVSRGKKGLTIKINTPDNYLDAMGVSFICSIVHDLLKRDENFRKEEKDE